MSYVVPQTHRIPVTEAEDMIERYQENMNKILNPELVARNLDILPISETFNKTHILEYLSQPEVVYFRLYPGMSPDMKIHTIIMGVDKDGHDLIPKNSGPGNPPGDPDDPIIFEDGLRCPSACPPPTCHFNYPFRRS